MTLLIKDVQILGGERDSKDRFDVFVTDDRISAIGKFPSKNADEVVEGQGAYLSPGFIDVNTDSDHYLTLFEDRGQEDFLRQGVTTIMGGMCGSSLAPLLYGSLESMFIWSGSGDRININWHSINEFLETIDKRPLAVNFGTFAGHSTIRRAIAGNTDRDLTKNETGVYLKTLAQAMKDGAFGLSTGLGYLQGKKVSHGELKTLISPLREPKGIHATHLRDMSEGVRTSVEEIIKLAEETGVSALISHFVPKHDAERGYEEALRAIDALPSGMDFHFDLYPFDELLVPLHTFLPSWAQNGDLDTMLANVKDDWFADRAKKEMEAIHDDVFEVAEAPGNDLLVGKSLGTIKEMYELKNGRDALVHLMRTTGLRATILYKGLDMPLITKAMKSPHALIASNAPSFGTGSGKWKRLKSQRTTSTFIKFLSLVEHDGLMPLPDAIRKITLEPAKKLGLKDRGLIKVGNVADLTCFKDAEVKFTVVGGKVVFKEGEFRQVFPGKALRHMAKQ